MSYSVVLISGKQHIVSPGDSLLVDRLQVKEGETISLDQVLLSVDGSKVAIGTPTLKAKAIKAKVLQHLKGQKIRVATFRAKSRYRRVKGHRQSLTKLQILPAKKTS